MSTLTRGAQRLSHLLAVERQVREAGNQAETLAHRAKPTDFEGHVKTYEPVDNDGLRLAADTKNVVTTVSDLIAGLLPAVAEAVDLEASKNETNTSPAARADLVLPDGTVLARQLAGPTLLHLETTLLRLRKIVAGFPELDPAVVWVRDENTGLRRSQPTQTFKTDKIETPLVLYPHSDKHPAQTKTVTKDKIIGTWTAEKVSGAIPTTEKRAILARLDVLVGSCKQARETANLAEVRRVSVAGTLMSYVFDGEAASVPETSR